MIQRIQRFSEYISSSNIVIPRKPFTDMENADPRPSKFRTDWSKCCLCQKKKNEELKSPRAQQPQGHDGYTMIATNIPLFYAINEMPIVLDPARLDDGGGLEETLRKNKAQYHQSCRLMLNNTKLERARKRRAEHVQPEECQTKLCRTILEKTVCFICDKEASSSELRQVMTMNLNNKLNECARNLNDGKLLARLSGGDAIAQELKYHLKCLTDLYNRERSHLRATKRHEQECAPEEDAHPQAFSELLTYLVETSRSSEGPTVFRLADLVNLYTKRLEQLGVEAPAVNSTRLKEKLLSEVPELEAHKQGRDVLLAFQKDVSFVLSDASDYYSEAIILGKAANILRRHMLNRNSKFCGTYHEGCIQQAIPPTLLQFVAMLEHGADIKSQLRFGASKTDVAIAQLLQYNCHAKYKEGAPTHRHSKDRETPFPVYIGLSVYTQTRQRTLVEKLNEHGISISYDRVLEISAQLGDATVSKYVEDGVVCPPVLRKGLFTTSAMDNIDHNPTATTATTSFHGTSISVFQHPTKESKGEERGQLKCREQKVKTVPELPDSFTNVWPAFFNKKKPSPPKESVVLVDTSSLLKPQLAMEYEWLDKVTLTDGPVDVTWSAHHASQRRGKPFEVSISSLLPLLRDQAHSVATVKHVMDKIREIVAFLNPSQVPIIAADQPIYAVAKQVQWHWPEFYGEDKFVIMFGGLHIEMAALKSIGTLLRDSGWTGALVEAGIASPGTADSFLTASSITRTRQMHQITACTLYKLLKAAYTDYLKETEEQPKEVFETWCECRKQHSPMFHFWYMVLSMELVILLLIRSFREANFFLYCQSLAELIPYFFANNNVNYARWLPIHFRDMVTLEKKHPQVAQEFQNGKFVVHKSSRQFSAVAIDQAHEQANAVIKGDGGAIGVTEDPSALRRWMIAGPEVSHLVAQYEVACGAKMGADHTSHHEETEQAQRVFLEKVEKFSKAMQDMGNPFQEDNRDLRTLDTNDIAHQTAAELVSTHLEKGKVYFQEFMKGLESEEQSTFYEPIKKNRVDFFRQVPVSAKSSKQNVLNTDCHLFSKLFISCQSRECDLKEFFRHENQSHPAALSDGGKLHTCQKSHLTSILQNLVTTPETEPDADTIIIDGAALVHSLPPRNSKTFEEYAMFDVLPTIQAYSTKYNRTDIVFDVYHQSSLKAETRSKRGRGVRRRVTKEGKIPSNWRNFLRENDNKVELFNFLADKIAHMSSQNVVIVTKEEDAVSNHTINLAGVAPCSHEESDTRIFVHARHATEAGSKVIMVKASDTDVLVIAVSVLQALQELGLQQLWLAFGQGQNLRWIPVHDLCCTLAEKSKGMLFFHAFTGCDIVSAFRGKGKKSAWQTWDVCDEASGVFCKLSKYPPVVDDEDLETLEKFVVMMYDRSSTAEGVDAARLDMFARKQRPYEAIPPTQGALKQHVKRAAYQAGCIWSQATVLQPEMQTPANWGWTKTGDLWHVIWTDLPPIAESCQQLTKCGCKSECCGRCKCNFFGLTCTALCSCRCEI